MKFQLRRGGLGGHENLGRESFDRASAVPKATLSTRSFKALKALYWFMGFLPRSALWKSLLSTSINCVILLNTPSRFWWIIISLHASVWAFKQTSFPCHNHLLRCVPRTLTLNRAKGSFHPLFFIETGALNNFWEAWQNIQRSMREKLPDE